MIPQSIDFLSKKDPIFEKIIQIYGIPTRSSRPQGFQTLSLLILEQQISIDSAKATYNKLKAKAPNFQPHNIIALTDEAFRNCGVSRQKTNYIKGLAQAILNNDIDLESLHSKSATQVRQELIQIKGIGNWTIDVYLLFALQSPDILPLGDIAILKTISELLDIHEKQNIEIYTQQWAPHRSMATFLLWHYYLQKRNRRVQYDL